MTSFVWSKNAWYVPYPSCVVISSLCDYKTLEQWATSCYAVLGLRLMQNHKFMFHLITCESLVWQSTWTYHVVVRRLEKKITLQLRCVKGKCFAILVSNFKATGVTNFFEAKTSALSKFKKNQVPFPQFVRYSTWSTWQPNRWTCSRNMLCWHSSPCKNVILLFEGSSNCNFCGGGGLSAH